MDSGKLVVATMGTSLTIMSIASLSKKYNCPYANTFADVSYVSMGISGLLAINWASTLGPTCT